MTVSYSSSKNDSLFHRRRKAHTTSIISSCLVDSAFMKEYVFFVFKMNDEFKQLTCTSINLIIDPYEGCSGKEVCKCK